VAVECFELLHFVAKCTGHEAIATFSNVSFQRSASNVSGSAACVDTRHTGFWAGRVHMLRELSAADRRTTDTCYRSHGARLQVAVECFELIKVLTELTSYYSVITGSEVGNQTPALNGRLTAALVGTRKTSKLTIYIQMLL
jgi:hypothetical protein